MHLVRIIHIIIGLNVGGAEMMLVRLLKYKSITGGFECMVVSLTDVGKLGPTIEGMGIRVIAINITSILNLPFSFIKLIHIIKEYRPNIVQTWMYHSDLLGGIAARICGVKRVIWNIRNTQISHKNFSLSYFLVKLCAVFSYFLPTNIVCCANSVLSFHVARGFSRKKMLVINNGYELPKKYIFSNSEKIFSRERIGINRDDFIIGAVGRFDILKDYKNFILGAAEFARVVPNTKFILVGKDINWNNYLLVNWILEANMSTNFILLGERSDINELFLAMDIFCSSSKSEGFSNVVAEAMAMRLPCVVTNVGDSALIVGDSGIVVPPEDYVALSEGFFELFSLGACGRLLRGSRARELIINGFSIDFIGSLYMKLYLSDEKHCA
ncbi:glycosyltransferase [Polynucleobacter difficilis]|uniref:glycosyltransferase n=1 Tax=Polynucleobacter difficilis TaxID=556054 RepID=UPI000D35000A|nr:glycosyltransferase [Polynucleobacter difficilis]